MSWTVAPNGCRWCGVERHHHVQHWTDGRGWHGYEKPSDAQRLERMKSRTAATGDPR